MKVYQRIASLIAARLNCEKSNNHEWFEKHEERLNDIARNILPSGSGFDSGTVIDLEESGPERVVLRTDFHHMNDSGMYDGWSEHAISITSSLQFGFTLRITGKDRNDIKDYIYQVFEQVLNEEYDSDSET